MATPGMAGQFMSPVDYSTASVGRLRRLELPGNFTMTGPVST